jgi:T5orf172 domain
VEWSEPPGRDRFKALVGKPGVIYVLKNDGLRDGWIKIGCSTRSGHARATDLNTDANTGTPGVFRCIYQLRTLDCGTAEQEVFARLSAYRRGKWGQEFFEVDLSLAKETINLVCSDVDRRRAADPPPRLHSTSSEVTGRPQIGGTFKPANLPGGTIRGRPGWRKSSGPPRRRWTTGAIIFTVLVLLVLVMGQGGQVSQRTSSSPATNVSSSGTKSAKPTGGGRSASAQAQFDAGSKRVANSPPGSEVARPNDLRQPVPSDGSQEPSSSGSLSNFAATQAPSAPVHAGLPSSTSETASKARDGEALGANRNERGFNASSCSSERMMQDPGAYSRCLNNQIP